VLPIKPGCKSPVMIESGTGHERASTDPQQVAEWWGAWRNANIATACGPNGLVVLDLDGGDAIASWRALHPQASALLDGATAVVDTPRGHHLWFRWDHSEGNAISNADHQLPEHINVRGQGGYVLVPPSIVNGLRYRWANQSRVSPLPTWLAERLRRSRLPSEVQPPAPIEPVNDRRLRGAIRSATERVRTAPVGRRNNTLSYETWSLLRLVELDSPEAEAIRAEMTAAALANPNPLDLPAITATIQSAFNRRARERQP
jgi:putative DNA primase/helicase